MKVKDWPEALRWSRQGMTGGLTLAINATEHLPEPQRGQMAAYLTDRLAAYREAWEELNRGARRVDIRESSWPAS